MLLFMLFSWQEILSFISRNQLFDDLYRVRTVRTGVRTVRTCTYMYVHVLYVQYMYSTYQYVHVHVHVHVRTVCTCTCTLQCTLHVTLTVLAHFLLLFWGAKMLSLCQFPASLFFTCQPLFGLVD